jgi:hypothetical protein
VNVFFVLAHPSDIGGGSASLLNRKHFSQLAWRVFLLTLCRLCYLNESSLQTVDSIDLQKRKHASSAPGLRRCHW